MTTDKSNIDFFRDKYNWARLKYKPRVIETLLIAEAPPCKLERYFYFEEVKEQDSLFLEIMGVLYPEAKENYLLSKREPRIKEELLNRFKEDGYWLLDLSDVPIELSGESYVNSLPSLLTRIKESGVDKKVPIILIKANVYDICYKPLKEQGYNVLNVRLPFPGSGQQRVFREKFKNTIT